MALLITRPSAFLPLLSPDDEVPRYSEIGTTTVEASKNYYPTVFTRDTARGERIQTRDPVLDSMKSQNVEAVSQFLGQNLPISYSPSFLMQFVFGKDCFCFCARDGSRASKAAMQTDNGIIGVVAGKILRSALDREVCTGHVMILAVATEWRRFGVGCELLKKLELAFHNVSSPAAVASITAPRLKSIFLHVASTNTGAIQFYEKGGYAFEKSEFGYYGRKADGIVMRKCVA
ncbi:hypothetical protein POJ06DRAFT_251258 [Lipomyces tetrasporus]|uniref:N-alpha-acetyltransferase 60 n=1 Tax=Lipomyces tetrasporus TaxID=54092 RepID=A0AAD7VUK7_9ASCO|nr:uncharacterized protein POJ06DRAFT_251258 [Lipomyces tetrasporus]KAJ8101350.1 hypothetical protein POJ06DRAFT_251258 [Lipomyces tetrasporus]